MPFHEALAAVDPYSHSADPYSGIRWHRWQIHATVLAAAKFWATAHIAIYMLSRPWRRFRKLDAMEKHSWANKLVSAMHALFIVAADCYNTRHLQHDPQHAVTWFYQFSSCSMCGFLLYDTAQTFLTGSSSAGSITATIVHHILSFAVVYIALIAGGFAYYGCSIRLWLEFATPYLNVMQCMRLLKLQAMKTYVFLGLPFMTLYGITRPGLSGYHTLKLWHALLFQTEHFPWWGPFAFILFGGVYVLNVYWFFKIVRMSARRLSMNIPELPKELPSTPIPGVTATLKLISKDNGQKQA